MPGKYDLDHPFKKRPKYPNYYNPNDYIQISPEEIEEQAKKALEIMKQNDSWHDLNVKANKWEETL